MNLPTRLRRFFTSPSGLALLILGLCLSVGWALLSRSANGSLSPTELLQTIQGLGHLGKLAYAGLLALAIVVSPIPGTPLTVAAGAIWNPWMAGLYGILGIFLGSLLAYFIGRTLGRSAIRALTGKAIHISNRRGETYLGWLVFITHLLPILPFDLVSYGAGMTRLSFPIYATSTLLGIIPCTFLLTYTGASFKTSLPLGMAIVALFLTLVVVLPWGVQRYNWLGLRDVIRIE